MADETEPHVIVNGNATGFAQKIQIGLHQLVADEPVSYGGTDIGASPYDLLLAALGSCTSMTIGLYARKRGWQDQDEEGRPLRRTTGIASLGGATLDNEENYLIKKLFVGLGIVQVENQARI